MLHLAGSENFTAHYYIMATKAVTLKSNNYKIAGNNFSTFASAVV